MEKNKTILTSDLVTFLKSTTVNSGFVDGLKVHYRPLICPFDDLVNYIRTKGTKRVFDVGCGSGQFAMLLAEFTHVSTISGIEIDSRLVANANQLLSRYKNRVLTAFNKYDGKLLPDSIADHDVVFLIDVLHHVPKPMQTDFLKQLYMRMKPGSELIIKDINAGSAFVYFNKLHDLIFAREIGNEWSVEKVTAVCKEIGFQIESVTKRQLYVYPHYTVLLKK
jgi:2-polyprenyl-3-methyl-5-hydroxy-6-metoxy-1,4-benzoquinol methylase